MDFLGALARFLGGHQQQQQQAPQQKLQQAQPMAPMAPLQQVGAPRQQEDSGQVFALQGARPGMMPLNQVNPGSPWANMLPYQVPRGLQLQPTVQAPSGARWNGLQPSTSFDQNLQGYSQEDTSNGLQGGTVNQGYIPFQGSRGTSGNVQSAMSPLDRLIRGK